MSARKIIGALVALFLCLPAFAKDTNYTKPYIGKEILRDAGKVRFVCYNAFDMERFITVANKGNPQLTQMIAMGLIRTGQCTSSPDDFVIVGIGEPTLTDLKSPDGEAIEFYPIEVESVQSGDIYHMIMARLVPNAT